MSNQSQGAVLAGQPVAVTAGSGITIDPNTGVISVNASTISGVMKLNNGSAYNAYQWPNGPGTNGQFLKTNGAGLVDWADVTGFAVVSVQSGAPTPADIGELWFDCDTGTLNVYQNCVGTPSPNWFNVAQPGFPVLPANTSSNVAWTGSGTQASPYQMTATTTGSGTAVQIINTVTIIGLAPFQYVPIVDLNAVANGGRFSFTNNYANASGVLVFDTVFTDQPPSGSGVTYNAAIKVGYGTVYIDAQVTVVAALVVTGGSITGPLYVGQQLTYTPGVPSGGSTPYGTPTYQWYADGAPIGSATGLTFTLTGAQLGKQITASTTYTDASSQTATGTSAAIGPVLANPGALTITSPGSIAPAANVVVGATLNYTAGTFTGGIPTVTPSWVWQRAGVDITGTANATSYITVPADSGQAITVRYQVQDSATPTPVTQFASTTAVTPTSPFPGGVWAPTPAGAMNNNDPGTSSGLWNGANGATITATGCAEVSTDGTNYFPSLTVNIGQTLYQRWKQTSLCGLADTGQTIQGSVSDGTYTNFYSLLINRVPSAPPSFTAATGAPGAAVDSNSQNISGMNSTTYITYDASSTGDATTYFAIINGGAAQAIPSAPSTSLTIESGDTLVLRQTASSTPATARNLVVNIGDADGSPRQQATYTLTAVSTPFPGITFSPASGPNAGPETVNGVTGGGTLGTLNGKASTSWTPVNTALTGSNIRMQINGTGGYSTSATAVNGQSLEIAWVTSYLDTITNGNSATGSISGTISGTTYTNPFSFTVKRTADFTTTSGASSGASGAITLVSQTPNNYNVPLKVYQNAPSSNALTSVTVDINSAGPVALPTSAATALTINPGQTIVFAATAPGTPATYTTDIVIGDTTKTWSYTVTVTPTVSTPSINNPTSGTTVDPTVNSPSGITVTTPASGTLGGFQTNYGGTQTAADWYVYKAIPQGPETSPILSKSSTGPSYTGMTTYTTDQNSTPKPYTSTDGYNGSGNYAGWPPGSTPGTGTGSGLTVVTTFNPPIPFTSSVLVNANAGGGGACSTTKFKINGVSYSNCLSISVSGVTLTGPGTLTSIEWGYDTGFWSAFYTLITKVTVDGVELINGTQTLTLTDNTNLSSMTVGDSVVEVGGGADASGVISAINPAGPTITLSPYTGTWTVGATVKDTTASPVIPPAPPALPPTVPDVTKYTAVSGFPLNKTSAFNSAFIAEANLTTSSKYYASVIYTGSGSVVSTAAAWSNFLTNNFVPSPGTPMAGGYYAGQIQVPAGTGTIYNIIVAPVTSGSLEGQKGGTSPTGLAWKTSFTGPDTSALSTVYGAPAMVAYNSATYPLFNWCHSGPTGPNAGTYDPTNAAGTGIGGFNDWYIPALNELEVCFYFLKPTTNNNWTSTAEGANPNAVAPEPVNTSYTATVPGQTSTSLFRSTGGQAFSSTGGAGSGGEYWTATDANVAGEAWWQSFSSGAQEAGLNKMNANLARAIRRVAA